MEDKVKQQIMELEEKSRKIFDQWWAENADEGAGDPLGHVIFAVDGKRNEWMKQHAYKLHEISLRKGR